MSKKQLLEQWSLAYSDTAVSEKSAPVEASVPGIVQTDMQKVLNMPSLYTGDHESEYAWMAEKYWHYTTKAKVEKGTQCPYLVLEHFDYWGEVYINGQLAFKHEGIFRPAQFSLDEYKGQEITIEVLLYPAPTKGAEFVCRGGAYEATEWCKPAFVYGWDWCPRFVTIGLSGPAYIEYRDAAYLTDVAAAYRLSDELDSAKVAFEYTAAACGELTLTLMDDTGAVVSNTVVSTKAGDGSADLEVDAPKLWWPNGQGEHPTYTLKAEHNVKGEIYTWQKTMGFRRIRLVPNEGTWEDNHGSNPFNEPFCASSQNRYPITIEINGRRIFAKGTNWVPPEMSLCQIDPARTRIQLEYVQQANMNIIRIWGGGFIYDEDFYETCNELGIMVWQEFPLSCATYSEQDRYLDILRQEVSYSIRRLRVHPCIALYCGGNELFSSWSGMHPQMQAIRLMDSLCYQLDRFTPFLPTSPMYGMGHGTYTLAVEAPEGMREHITMACEDTATAYTEFGCGGPSEWEYLKTLMSEEELNNGPLDSGVWKARHAAFGFHLSEYLWFGRDAIPYFTHCAEDTHTLVDVGVEFQARMYPMLFEEARRQWPYCSMALNWCYNEPWPTAAGNSLINYPYHRKPCYYTVQDALRDRKLSLRFTKVCWKKGETLTFTPWVLNSSPEVIKAGCATITATMGDKKWELGEWDYQAVEFQCNLKGEDISLDLPDTEGDLVVEIKCEDETLNAVYKLFIV